MHLCLKYFVMHTAFPFPCFGCFSYLLLNTTRNSVWLTDIWRKLHFLLLQDFGEVPVYLNKRKEEMQRAQEEYDAYVAEHFRRGALRCLTNEERQIIINGLKSNWEDIHEQYQGLSVVTDTTPKKNRKERMEAQMKQLEKDIEMFEKFTTIYIGNWRKYSDEKLLGYSLGPWSLGWCQAV